MGVPYTILPGTGRGTECINREDTLRHCKIEEREDGAWTVSTFIENGDVSLTLVCGYLRRAN